MKCPKTGKSLATAYKAGCRCEVCRTWKREDQSDRRVHLRPDEAEHIAGCDTCKMCLIDGLDGRFHSVGWDYCPGATRVDVAHVAGCKRCKELLVDLLPAVTFYDPETGEVMEAEPVEDLPPLPPETWRGYDSKGQGFLWREIDGRYWRVDKFGEPVEDITDYLSAVFARGRAQVEADTRHGVPWREAEVARLRARAAVEEDEFAAWLLAEADRIERLGLERDE